MRLAAMTRQLVDFCYPARCIACGETCDASDRVCGTCDGQLLALERAPRCDLCAMPLAQHGGPCPYCMNNGLTPFDKIIRLTVFDEPIRKLIHQMKYHERWGIGEFLADRLLAQESVKGLMPETECIVPVPLYWWKQIKRGYNQSEVIARRLAAVTGNAVRKPIVRLINTESQTNLSATKRAENMRDAFGLVDAKSIRGRHVVLVDDVMTTGATLQSAARAMKSAEPASLCAIVVAIADPLRRGFEAI